MMAFSRRHAVAGGLALAASALGGSACAPPVRPGSAVDAPELYVGLARERAVVILDAYTDRVKRRISLAPLGKVGITGQIAVAPSGDAAVLPLMGAAPDVGVIQATEQPQPAARRGRLDGLRQRAHRMGMGAPAKGGDAVRCARVQVSVGTKQNPEQSFGLVEGAQGLATDLHGAAYVLVGDAIGAEPTSVAVVDMQTGAVGRRLPLAEGGERVVSIQAQPDGTRLFASIWRRSTHDAAGNWVSGSGRVVALDTRTGRVLARADAPAGLAITQLALAAAPPDGTAASAAATGGGGGVAPAAQAPAAPAGAAPASSSGATNSTSSGGVAGAATHGGGGEADLTLYAVVTSGSQLNQDEEWLGYYDPKTTLVAYEAAFLQPIAVWSLKDRPAAIAVRPDGTQAYLLAGSAWGYSLARALVQMDLADGSTKDWPLPSGCLSLTMGPAGKVYVADTFGDRLWRLDPRAPAYLTYIPLAGAPMALCARPA